MKLYKNILAISIWAFINGCSFSQNITLKNLDIQSIQNMEVNSGRIDTVMLQMQISKPEQIDFLYFTIGYIDSAGCKLNNQVCKILKERDQVFLETVTTKKRYIIKNNFVKVTFYIGDLRLSAINYARANTSNNKGEYSKTIYFKNSETLSKIDCKIKN